MGLETTEPTRTMSTDNTTIQDNDDFSILMNGEMYQSTEEHIFELEKALLRLVRRVEELKEENKRLTDALFGHLKSIQ